MTRTEVEAMRDLLEGPHAIIPPPTITRAQILELCRLAIKGSDVAMKATLISQIMLQMPVAANEKLRLALVETRNAANDYLSSLPQGEPSDIRE